MSAPKANRLGLLFKKDKNHQVKEQKEVEDLADKIKNLLKKEENAAKAALILETWLRSQKK